MFTTFKLTNLKSKDSSKIRRLKSRLEKDIQSLPFVNAAVITDNLIVNGMAMDYYSLRSGQLVVSARNVHIAMTMADHPELVLVDLYNRLVHEEKGEPTKYHKCIYP